VGGLKRGEAVAVGILVAVLPLTLLADEFVDTPREPIAVILATLSADGRELRLGVNTCQGKPEVTKVSEDERQVVITVVSDVQEGEGPGCMDGALVRLSKPLQQRRVLDGTTNRAVAVERHTTAPAG
jgi:hypothetical protein